MSYSSPVSNPFPDMKRLLLAATLGLATLHADGAIIQFDLQGTAGFGLLPGNEPGAVTGGTGGEFGLGITYDDVTNVLDLTNVGWGSSQGFTNLSSSANNSHIHGPTAANNGNGFTQTAGVLVNLTRSSNAVTGGTFTNPLVDLDLINATSGELHEADLMNGKWYINIHTANNGGGELRGFLKPVPEPGTTGLLCLGALALAARRRRK